MHIGIWGEAHDFIRESDYGLSVGVAEITDLLGSLPDLLGRILPDEHGDPAGIDFLPGSFQFDIGLPGVLGLLELDQLEGVGGIELAGGEDEHVLGDALASGLRQVSGQFGFGDLGQLGFLQGRKTQLDIRGVVKRHDRVVGDVNAVRGEPFSGLGKSHLVVEERQAEFECQALPLQLFPEGMGGEFASDEPVFA